MDPFRRELAERTRLTGIAAGFVGIAGYLGWIEIDRLLAPTMLKQFLLIRLTVVGFLLIGTLLLLSGRARGRAADATTMSFVVAVQCGIAWMVPQVPDEAVSIYLLGFTLAIYGMALLIEWPWTYTMAMVAMTWSALLVADLLAPRHLLDRSWISVIVYVGTSSLTSLVGHALRYRVSRREFVARADAEAARADAERERQQNAELLRRLDHLSRHDPLTDLPNRRYFDERFRSDLERAVVEGTTCVLVLLDIDFFKRFNDTHGHQVGDAVLRSVAEALRARMRREDLPARYGGEEFAVVLPGIPLHDVAAVVDDLRHRVQDGAHTGDERLAVTLSAGAAIFPLHGTTTDELVRAADLALYTAKRAGRDRFCVADAVRSTS